MRAQRDVGQGGEVSGNVLMADNRPDSERGLDEIRREVIESRNLVIKTDNLLKNLHAELKLLGKRQEDFQRRQWISSGVAYATFAALCVTGAILLSSARASAAFAEKSELEKRLADVTSQLDRLRADTSAMQQASRQAADVYRMMTTLPGDERLKGVDALRKLDLSMLSALEKQALQDRADALRKEIGQAAFERGKAAFRRNDYAAAVEDLGRFLAMGPSTEEALDASFFLGASLLQVRRAQDAVIHLERFVNGDKKSKTRDYAMLLLAQAYDQTQQYDKALEIARDALATYPNSEFAGQLKGRLFAAKRGVAGANAAQLPGADGSAAPAPAPAAASAQPQNAPMPAPKPPSPNP